jgi:hypothetical protein
MGRKKLADIVGLFGNKKMWELGMPKLKLAPAPGVSESIQHGIFAYFVPPIALYSLLGGIMWLQKNVQI